MYKVGDKVYLKTHKSNRYPAIVGIARKNSPYVWIHDAREKGIVLARWEKRSLRR